MPGRVKQDELRTRIAIEAARILAEDQIQSFDTARRKAAHRVGCSNRRRHPDNLEIQKALTEYQKLFRGETQPLALKQLRKLALDAMRSFSRFQPRLVGSVLEGTADVGSKITVRLYSDSPEEISLHLMQMRIPWKESEQLVRYSQGRELFRDVYRFHAGDTLIELVSLPRNEMGTPPLDPVSGRPERGATIDQLSEMLSEQTCTAE